MAARIFPEKCVQVSALALVALGALRLSADEDPRAKALRAKVTEAVIAKWAPEIHFHVHERYFPTSIEDLVKGAKLYQDGDPQKSPGLVTREKAIPITSPNDLAGRGAEWRIAYDPANPKVAGGDRGPNGSVTAPMYVSVQIPADGSYVNLVYRFVFGFNGPQSMRCHDGTSNFNYSAPHLAEHEGDWEGVTVMLSPDLNSFISAITESHGNTVYHLLEDLDWTEGTHCQVRSALNSHGMYNGKGKNPNDWIILEDLKVLSVIDIITKEGPTWQPWKQQNRPFRMFGSVKGGSAQQEKWTTYSGRLGSYKKNTLTGPRDVSGGSLSGGQSFKANAQAFLIGSIRTFGALGDTMYGAPCSGPGGRSDFQWDLPAETVKASKPCVIYSRVGNNLVLSVDPNSPNGLGILSPYRKGEDLQRWTLWDVGDGRVQFINVKTWQSLRLMSGGQGKRVAMYAPQVKSVWNTWTISGDRKNNCAIRPVVTDSQNLNAFGNGPWRDGSPVGTWEWGRGAGNETWRIVED